MRYANGRMRALDYEAGKFGVEIEEGRKKNNQPVDGTLAFSPDRKLFVAAIPPVEGSWTHGVRVYEWPSGKPLHTFIGHTAAVMLIAFSPDGKTLATGSQDATVLLWDLTAAEK